jgi:hypothetical protein
VCIRHAVPHEPPGRMPGDGALYGTLAAAVHDLPTPAWRGLPPPASYEPRPARNVLRATASPHWRSSCARLSPGHGLRPAPARHSCSLRRRHARCTPARLQARARCRAGRGGDTGVTCGATRLPQGHPGPAVTIDSDWRLLAVTDRRRRNHDRSLAHHRTGRPALPHQPLHRPVLAPHLMAAALQARADLVRTKRRLTSL